MGLGTKDSKEGLNVLFVFSPDSDIFAKCYNFTETIFSRNVPL